MDSKEIAEIKMIESQVENALYDDVRMKVVDKLTDTKYNETLSDLSPNEIKQLTKLFHLGVMFNCPHKMGIYHTYIKLKNSNERKSRTAIEGIGNPRAYLEGMSWTQRNITQRGKAKELLNSSPL